MKENVNDFPFQVNPGVDLAVFITMSLDDSL